METRSDLSFIKAQSKALMSHRARNAALTARVQELADEVSTLTEQRDGLLELLEATVQYTTSILEAI
jgi:cell division protein FtsB